MVYESDFYTTRRPYRTTPSLSTYTYTTTLPSRQVRILPGLGKVHVVHTYDRIVPYVGHKRLTVITPPPTVFRVRPSVLYKEFDRIERKYRPSVYYSPTNHYLNSDSAVRMIYVRNPYTGINYYTSFRPIRLSTSRWLDLLKYDYNPLLGYRYYKYDYPSSNWADYLNTLYGYKYHLLYRPFGGSYDYLKYYYYPLLGYPYYRYYYPYSTWYDYVKYYRNIYDSIDYDSVYRPLKSIFDDETRSIRAESAALLKRIHSPVLRAPRSLPILTSYTRYDDLSAIPARLSNDNYIYRMLNPTSTYTTYYTEPVKKFIGQGHLSCVTYGGERAYGRRRHLYFYEDPVKNDIQLLSYYINKFRQEKAIAPREPTKVPLSTSRPSRIFSSKVSKPLSDNTPEDIKKLREEREARLAKIYADEPKQAEDPVKKAQKEKEEARLAEERALAEEAARREAEAKKEAERKAERARQEELAAQAAAERAAELERQAEQTRQEELARQKAIEKARQEEEERARLEEERRLEELARAEEERQQLLRLEEIARQAEQEKEAELARQAEELAELARQEAELAEQAKREEEEAELARKQAELDELRRQEEELAELERQEQELAELAKQEAELAEKAREEADRARQEAEEAELQRQEAENARKEAELAELERQEAELAELERQQAELDALEAEAKALAEQTSEPAAQEPEEDEPAGGDSDAAVAEGPQTDEDIPAEEEPIVDEPEAEDEE